MKLNSLIIMSKKDTNTIEKNIFSNSIFSYRNFLLIFLLVGGILTSTNLQAQTPGLIYKPAGNALGKSVLDPNGDGYVSLTTTGFGATDYGAASELNMVPFPIVSFEPSGDLSTGSSGGQTDIVSFGSNTNQSAYILYKTVGGTAYLIFRFRLGGASTATKGFSVLFDTDGAFAGTGVNLGYEKEVVMNTGSAGSVDINTFNAAGTITGTTSFTLDNYCQRSIAGSTVDGSADYYYDFFVPYSSLGISSFVRIAAATISSAGSGISGTKSDFNGINDALYGNNAVAIANVIINSFPSSDLTTLIDGASFSNPISLTPVLNTGISTASTSISGSSAEANGTTITVYKGGVSIGTTTVSSGVWTLTGVSGLVQGNTITAKATASGKSISSASNAVDVTDVDPCFTPIPLSLTRGASQTITGTYAHVGGSAITASTVRIRLYSQTSSTTTFTEVDPTTTVYVATNGNWSFVTSLTNNTFNGTSFVATATFNSCMSAYSNINIRTNGNAAQNGYATATPTMVTTSILSSATVARSVQVTNADANPAVLILYRNGNEIARTASTVAANTSNTFSYTGFTEGDTVYARAQSATANYWISNISTKLVVTASSTPSTAPSISGTYIAGSGKTVSGTSTELAGTTISLYKASTTLLGTTTVTNYGTWSIASLTLATSDVLTATAKAVGKTTSAASTSVTVQASAPTAPTISGSYQAGATSVSGTGGLGTGNTITVYVDGSPIGTILNAAASWTLSSIAAGQIYKGAVITATNTNTTSNITSAFSAGVTVTGINSFLITNTSDAAIATQTAGTAFSIKIVAKDAANGTGNTVTTFTGKVTLSSSSVITSGSGTTASFTSGILNPQSVTLTTSGSNKTITAVSVDDPTTIGVATIALINPATVSKLAINAPSDIVAGSRAAYTVSRMDLYNNLTTTGATTVYLTSIGSTGVFYDASTGGNAISSVSISAASSSANFWFTATTVGSYTITASDASPANGNTGLTDTTDAINISVGTATNYLVTIPADALAGSTVAVTAQLKDAYNNSVSTSGQTVTWSSTNSGNFSSATSSTNSSGLASVNFTVSNLSNTSHVVTATTSSVTGSATTTVGSIQDLADFRTRQSGNLNSPTSWQYTTDGGTTWVNATQAPSTRNNITILNGMTITQNTDLTIASGKTFTINSGGAYVINSTKVFSVAGTADFGNNSVTLESNINGNASIGQITGSLINATNVTAQRYVKAKRSWRFVCAPVIGSGSTNSIFYNWQNNDVSSSTYGVEIWSNIAGDADPSSTNSGIKAAGIAPSLKIYTNNTWVPISNTNTSYLSDGTTNNAYCLYVSGPYQNGNGNINTGFSNTILSATGSLIIGDHAKNLGTATTGQFFLVANPYACAVEPDSVAANSQNIATTLYMWDPTTNGSYNQGQYVAFNSTTSQYNVTSGAFSNASNGTLTRIQSGQSFFVKALAAGNVTINFKERYKSNVSGNNVFRTNSANSVQTLRNTIRKSVNGQMTNLDGAVGIFYDGGAPEITGDDAIKLNNSSENIALRRANGSYVFEERPIITDKDTLFLRISNMQQTNYSLEMIGANLTNTPGLTAFLKDNYTNTTLPLSITDTNTYSFNVDANAASTGDRFMVVFKSNTTLPVQFTNINAYQKGTSVQIDWKVSAEKNIQQYIVEKSTDAISFVAIATQTANTGNNNSYTALDITPVSGNNYYRIQSIAKDGSKIYSNVVVVKIGGKQSSINVYPNPIVGNTMNVQLQNQAKGKYSIELINSLGRIVFQTNLQHAGGSASQSIVLPNSISLGNYVLKVVDEKGIQSTEKVMINAN